VCDAYCGTQTSMQAKPGKTLRVGDSYKVVDSSNSSAFVLIAEVTEVFEKGLAKPIYTRAREATKHHKAGEITNLISQYKLIE